MAVLLTHHRKLTVDIDDGPSGQAIVYRPRGLSSAVATVNHFISALKLELFIVVRQRRCREEELQQMNGMGTYLVSIDLCLPCKVNYTSLGQQME